MAFNLLDLQTSVADDLKDPAFSMARLSRYANRGQQAIFNTHMFRFTEKSIVGTLTVDSYAYDQQPDHEATIGGVIIDTTTGNKTVLDDTNYIAHRQFFELYPDPNTNDIGMPSFWTEFGDQIVFNCPADKAYTFKQRYYRIPDDIEDTNNVPTVPKNFREILEFYMLFRAEKYRGNHDVAGTYKQEYEDGLEAMVLRYAEVQQAGPVVMPTSRVRVNV